MGAFSWTMFYFMAHYYTVDNMVCDLKYFLYKEF